MLLCNCFRFSEVMDQMFLSVRDAVQGSFRATPLPLFMSSYDQDGELGDVTQPRVFVVVVVVVNLDYPDLTHGNFDF